jgi:hypothetical protein
LQSTTPRPRSLFLSSFRSPLPRRVRGLQPRSFTTVPLIRYATSAPFKYPPPLCQLPSTETQIRPALLGFDCQERGSACHGFQADLEGAQGSAEGSPDLLQRR